MKDEVDNSHLIEEENSSTSLGQTGREIRTNDGRVSRLSLETKLELSISTMMGRKNI